MATTKNTTTPTTPAPTTPNLGHMVAVRDLKDFHFDSGMQDVRGWEVTGPGATRIGTVDRMLVDGRDKSLRYLAIQLPENRGQLLLPIGAGAAHVARKQVSVEGLAPEVLKMLPTITQALVTVSDERLAVKALAGEKVAAATPEEWYKQPFFNAQRLFAGATTTKVA